jgi:hypothetical protein
MIGAMLIIGSSLIGLSGTTSGSSKNMSIGVFGEYRSGDCKLIEPRYAGDLRCEYLGELTTSNRTFLACASAVLVTRERPISRDVLGAGVVLGEYLAVLWPAESGTEAERSIGDDGTYPLGPAWEFHAAFLGIGADAGGRLCDTEHEAMSMGDGIFFFNFRFDATDWDVGAIGKSNGKNPITTSSSSGEEGLL